MRDLLTFLGESPSRFHAVENLRQTLEQEYFDYFIFGHRHLPLDISLSPKSRYINTSDWITHYTYAVFDGEQVALKKLSED